MLDLNIMAGIPIGHWVALSQDEAAVVAHGCDLNAVITEAKLKGESYPRITGTSDARELIGILRDA